MSRLSLLKLVIALSALLLVGCEAEKDTVAVNGATNNQSLTAEAAILDETSQQVYSPIIQQLEDAEFDEVESPATTQALGLLADIRVHDADELLSTLMRVDELFERGDIAVGTDLPVVFLLHGNEAKTLYRDQYEQNKAVVDLAAKLSAFGVVDIKVCERWAGNQGLDKSNLQPFVGTVSFAAAEKRRLLEEQGYIYF